MTVTVICHVTEQELATLIILFSINLSVTYSDQSSVVESGI